MNDTIKQEIVWQDVKNGDVIEKGWYILINEYNCFIPTCYYHKGGEYKESNLRPTYFGKLDFSTIPQKRFLK